MTRYTTPSPADHYRPWSVFSYPDGSLIAKGWAEELLSAIGAPRSVDNVRMVYQWETAEGGGGAYNPLNQGPVPGRPGLTSTGSQYGGGAADYRSWADGIAGAVAYLGMSNFLPVRRALAAGDANAARNALWNSPWAASHYGYGRAWPYVDQPSGEAIYPRGGPSGGGSAGGGPVPHKGAAGYYIELFKDGLWADVLWRNAIPGNLEAIHAITARIPSPQFGHHARKRRLWLSGRENTLRGRRGLPAT